MKILTYEIRDMMGIEAAARNMILLAKTALKNTPDEDVKVEAIHNGIAVSATWSHRRDGFHSTMDSVVSEWSKKHRERDVLARSRAEIEVLRENRIYPVRVAVLYLLNTLSDSDRLVLFKEIASNPLLKEGA